LISNISWFVAYGAILRHISALLTATNKNSKCIKWSVKV
jgi:hypothetical protein